MNTPIPVITNQEIRSLRSERSSLDLYSPFDVIVEKERLLSGDITDFLTVFITNKTCPFACLMCDLWKYTVDERVPEGAVYAQIERAISNNPDHKHIKLYNAGNFFDEQAIPGSDVSKIADIVRNFETVVIECHPKLVDKRTIEFANMLNGQLEVAMGLETIDPDVVNVLNKNMTLEDFRSAVSFLSDHNIKVRSFILIKTPYQNEEQAAHWALESLKWAYEEGVSTCTLIPTRAGNGIMDKLSEEGHFSSPVLDTIEQVCKQGMDIASQFENKLLFIDTWDLEALYKNENDLQSRMSKLHQANLSQVYGT